MAKRKTEMARRGKSRAAMITVNLNAELFWLQIDPECKNMPKTLSLGQYGMTRGVDRILQVLEEKKYQSNFLYRVGLLKIIRKRFVKSQTEGMKSHPLLTIMNIWRFSVRKSRRRQSERVLK